MEFGLFAYSRVDKWAHMDDISIVAPCMMFDARDGLRPSAKSWRAKCAEIAGRGRRVWAWGWMQPESPEQFIQQVTKMTEAWKPETFVLNAEIASTIDKNWTGATEAQVEVAIDGLRKALPGVPILLSSHGYPKTHMPTARFAKLVDGVTAQAYNAKRKYKIEFGETYMDRVARRWRESFVAAGNDNALVQITTGVNNTLPANMYLNVVEAIATIPDQPIMLWAEGEFSALHAAQLRRILNGETPVVAPTDRSYNGPDSVLVG